MRAPAIVLAASLAAPALAAGGATIELRPHVEVRDTVVTLGQVARLESTDLSLMRMLVNLPVGHARWAASESMLRRADVERRLARVGVEPQQIVWGGAQEVRLLNRPTRVSGEAIARVAADALRSALAAAGVRGEIGAVAPPRDVPVKGGNVHLKARPVASRQLRARNLVWIELWSAGAYVRSVPVSLDVQLTAGGNAITPPGEPDTSSFSTGKRFQREAPVVARGEWADLRTTLGAVVLESRVRVLQDGRTGDRIRVHQQGATGVVFARVQAAGLLELVP